MDIDVLTIFPGLFAPFLEESIIGLAREKGLVDIRLTNLRDFAPPPHFKVDDRPYGGGAGMVLQGDILWRALEKVEADGPPARKFLLSPQGKPFGQPLARELSGGARLILVCGRYEGFDERIRLYPGLEELSLGDYVLNGGEVAAMAVIEAVVRLLPRAVGDPESVASESFERGLLDYPQYTRPESFRGLTVPPVLLSGDHARIRAWREEEARRRTRERRPDLQ